MVCTLLAGVNVVAFAADSDESLTDTVSVLRAYNPNNSEHLMTVDETEYNANVARGYEAEGEAWIAPLHSNTEVWRAYNPNSGEHMLAPEAEVKALEAAGWQNEGLKMYSCEDEENVPIYRVFNPNATNAGSHHYCGQEEAAGLVAAGWQWDNNGEPVIYGCLEEPPVILVGLTDAKQLTANSIWVEFDQDASLLVNKDDITVAKADGTLTLPINNMEFDPDGMGATLTFAVPLQDSVDYNVDLNASEVSFTASVGAVDSVVVLTSSAKQGESTPIKFALYDEMGIDVTSTVSVNKTCQIDVDGLDIVPDINTPSEASIIMNTVGEEATVTITYTPSNSDEEEVVGVGTITCIEAEALQGTGIYKDVNEKDQDEIDQYINAKSQCVKFYWGLIDMKPVSVEVGKENSDIYWCAGDLSTFDVYDYDSYEVESSDEDILSVIDNTPTEGGKYLNLAVAGNAEGTANIVITATKNEKDAIYTIPVVVNPEGKLKSVKIATSLPTMTNAVETDYYGTIKVTAVDSNGVEIDKNDTGLNVSYTSDEKNKYQDGTVDEKFAGAGGTQNADLIYTALTTDATLSAMSGFHVQSGDTAAGAMLPGTMIANTFDKVDNKLTAAYSAIGAAAGAYKVNVTVSKDNEVIDNRSTTITVKDVSAAYLKGATGVALTYKTELKDSTINELNTPFTVAHLAAYYNGSFVGYVRSVGTDTVVGSNLGDNFAVNTGVRAAATGSAVNVNKTSFAQNLVFGAKFGGKYAVSKGKLMSGLNNKLDMDVTLLNQRNVQNIQGLTYNSERQTNMAALQGGPNLAMNVISSLDLAGVMTQNLEMDVADSSYDDFFATPGKYVVTYQYDQTDASGKTKSVPQPANLTVTNQIVNAGMYPQIDVTTRNVDSLSASDIIDKLTSRTDINNNDSARASIGTGIYAKDHKPAVAESGKNKLYVAKVTAEETFGKFPTAFGSLVFKVNFYVPINTTFYTEE